MLFEGLGLCVEFKLRFKWGTNNLKLALIRKLLLKFTETTWKISIIESIQPSSCLRGLCNLCVSLAWDLNTQLTLYNTRTEEQHSIIQLSENRFAESVWRNTNHHRNWAYVFAQLTQNWMTSCVTHCRQNIDRENFCSSLIFKYIILKGKLDKNSMHKER